MKQGFFIVFIGLLLISSCTNTWKNKDYSFADGFADLQELDKTYNATFKEEQLNATMVSVENIDPLLEQLQERQENIEETKESDDKQALLFFIDIREDMLLAEKNFQFAQKIGDIGLVTDEKGFSCAEARYILDAAYYYNESFTYARKAQFKLDDLLYRFGSVAQLQDLIGINQQKTAFYKSPLDHVHKIIQMNHEALEKNCKIKVVTE